MDWEQYQNAYLEAAQPVRDLLDSDAISRFLDTILTDTTHKPKLLIAISNRILSLIKDSEMIAALETIPGMDMTTIGKIKSFIDSSLQGTATNPATTGAETVPAMRTMSSDSKQIGYSSVEEPTYTTMQSAIINERK